MNTETTRDKIIKAMYILTAEKGYDKTSLGQIADIVGIKKASIYYYFQSKEEIFVELVREVYSEDFGMSVNRFEDITDPREYMEELINMGDEFIDSYFENIDLRKFYGEVDIQTTRINMVREICIEGETKLKEFLNKITEYGANIGAFNVGANTSIKADVLYMVLTGIDNVIVYNLPGHPKPVWKEVVKGLMSYKKER